MLMGHVRMPFLRSYWSKNSLYFHPVFGKTNTMSRNRYELILKNLCFYSPDEIDNQDRLHKISNLSSYILNNLSRTYYPCGNLSIDEAMLLCRRRLRFRFIRNKRHKYGIKLYELCSFEGFILVLDNYDDIL